MKKIIIFGATGMSGLCAVEAAVNKGLSVRAFVRDPSKLPDHLKSKVEVVKGDVLEPDSVNDAVAGVDGVVIVLGTRNALDATTDMSEGTKNIIEAIKQAGIKAPISVCLSSFLFFDPDKIPPRFSGIHDDHVRMYEAVKESGLNYIAVCPPHIETDQPSREIKVFINTNKDAGRTVTKWDLGKFLVDALNEPSYYKNRVIVCNTPKQ